MENGEHPLLLSSISDEYRNSAHEEDPVGSGTGIKYFYKEFCVESKKLWYLAAPAIFTSICQYSLGAITQVFAGQLGTTELAMVSVENSIVAGFCYGILWGMGSALETLCGIAFGAGQLSLASALMLALEIWYTMALTLFAGYLNDAEVSVDASSICLNIMGWAIMVGFGFNAAISVRVSNELGAANPRAAKISAAVVGVTSALIGFVLALVLIVTGKQYPSLFSTDADVIEIVYELTPLLAAAILIYNIQFSLAGVAIGAGWQSYVAYVNLGCYYLVGIPTSLLLAFKFDMGVQGIWWGILVGTTLEASILSWIIYRTNWNKEASSAGDKLQQWGGILDDI
ncbi:hypothetical protein Vadar_012627 [Vaccinium darrowii]|uniref:Uncharacterized protein n=1 Tax=Vaccinium darrowii TaxID=229202 RepID=A0ACB7YUY2_9ERIC|nr:hypothetical protein Vadar_012627 [Vaccinium darrowii]